MPDNDVINPYSAESVESPRAHSLWKQLLNWFLALLVVFLVVIVLPVTFLLGVLLGEGSAYRRRAANQEREIRQFADSRRDYECVDYRETSAGEIYLSGTVATQDHLDALRAECERLFGEEAAKRMTRRIEVSPKP